MSPEYCMTPGCVQAAADILSNMDHSVNPCEDFYQFACGGFIEKTVIPDDRTRMSSFSVLSDELLTQVGVLSWIYIIKNSIVTFIILFELIFCAVELEY